MLVLTNRFDISTVFDISVFEISKFNCNIVCSLSCFTCGIFRLISLDFQFVGVQLHRLNYKLQGAFETNEVFFSRQSKKKFLIWTLHPEKLWFVYFTNSLDQILPLFKIYDMAHFHDSFRLGMLDWFSRKSWRLVFLF